MRKIVLLIVLLFSLPVAATFTAGVNYFDNQQFSQAFAEFKPLADEGYAPAQYYTAYLYLNGYGVGRDEKAGMDYLKKAVDQGFEKAMTLLGYYYSEGKMMRQDKTKARELYEQAAEGEDDDALLNLGVMYYNGDGVKKDLEKAIGYFERVSLTVKPIVGRYLGDIYQQNNNAVDQKKAKDYYTMAAFHGDLGSFHSLGYMISSSQDSSKNMEEAIQYYRYAASQSYAPSQYAMGTIYANGDGVERNLVTAYAWMTLAANQGFVAANQAQQTMEKNMTLSDLERARYEVIELQKSVIGKLESPLKEIQEKLQKASTEENVRKKRARSRRRRAGSAGKKATKAKTEEEPTE